MGTVKHKIFLSGTAIKNNSIEYFPALNLLAPERFPERQAYVDQHVDYYWSGKSYKAGGLRDPEGFKDLTKDIIIRRLRKEVLPDLPTVTRDYRYYEMGKEVAKAYNRAVGNLEDFLDNSNRSDNNWRLSLQGHMMILYHITGLSKVGPILEYCDEWLEGLNGDEPEKQKLSIFHHHVDVGDLLQSEFEKRGVPAVRIISRDDTAKRTEILDRFRNDNDVKIFLGPTLACGEGIDLEFCQHAIQAEREWNPANEEQVEGRFIRATPEVVQRAKEGLVKISMMIPVAVGTIDEFFAELVEQKRQSVKQTLDGKVDHSWNQSEVMLELAKIAVKNRIEGRL